MPPVGEQGVPHWPVPTVSSRVLATHQLWGWPSLQNVPTAHWLWLVHARRHLAPAPLASSMHASPWGHPAVVHEDGPDDDEHAESAKRASAAKSTDKRSARRKAFGAVGRPCSMT